MGIRQAGQGVSEHAYVTRNPQLFAVRHWHLSRTSDGHVAADGLRVRNVSILPRRRIRGATAEFLALGAIEEVLPELRVREILGTSLGDALS